MSAAISTYTLHTDKMGFVDFIRRVLVPSDDSKLYRDTQQTSHSVMVTRQDILDSLRNQFLEELRNETTTESILFHSSYVIYLRQDDYNRILPGFSLTADDAVKQFIREIKKRINKYPDFRPLFRHWAFQLVCIPDGTIIDGMSEDEVRNKLIIIKSTLVQSDEYRSTASTGRIVTTMHTVNSMKAIPSALNISVLSGLDQVSRNIIRVTFDPRDELGFGSPAVKKTQTPVSHSAVAVLKASDGQFIGQDGVRFSTYQIKSDRLQICGRNAMSQSDIPTLLVDSEEVMNPHVILTRDTSGSFSIIAMGDVRLNERRVDRNPNTPHKLPNNSSIIINNDVEINFKTL